VPEWFPGGRFKKIAREMFEDREQLYEVPFHFVREQMESQVVRGRSLLLTLVTNRTTAKP
jgi:hypothetical protein